MNNLRLSLFFLVLLCLLDVDLFAYTCKVDGICYNLNRSSHTATVTYSGYPYNNEYTGHYGGDGLHNKDIVIPSMVMYEDVAYTVVAIGDNAFYDCESSVLMSSVTISNAVTSIGKQAFWKCKNLTSLDIPNSVTSIGESAFYGCLGLTSVRLPSSVSSIGQSAFGECRSLQSVSTDTAEPIDITAFTFSNRANATLYVPAGSKAAYEAADYWNEFKEIVEMPAPSPAINFADANVKALCVAKWDTDGDGELSEAEASAVTDLGEVFRDNQNIKSFDELQYFVGLSSIEHAAFSDCSNLTAITIPSSVKSIGYQAFEYCSGLTSIEIPNGVTSIKSNAFSGCSGITSVEIPNGVTEISESVFSGCSGLISVTIPNSVTTIGSFAFDGCKALASITIPNSVTTIGCNAFYDCSSLTSFDIPDGVTCIDGYVFDGCSGLISVTIPSSVTEILDGAFSCCSGLTSINIPNSVKYIGNDVFYGCIGLTSVEIPNGVTSIGSGAFNNCYGLTSVKISSSVTTIGDYAFGGFNSLTSVTVEALEPVAITSEVFSNRANATLFVPAGSKAAYEAADYWKEFKEIVEQNGEQETTDISTFDNTVYIENVETYIGGQLTLSVKMKNAVQAEGFGFDLYLPDGVTVATDGDGFPMVELSTERTTEKKTNSFDAAFQTDGSLRVLAASTNGSVISGNDGEVCLVTVNIADDMEEGDYPIVLKNIAISDVDAVSHRTEMVKSMLTVSAYTPADANNDGVVDVSDFTATAHYLLGNPPAGFNEKAADANNDKVVDVADLTATAHIILYGSITKPAQSGANNSFDPQ